MRRRVLLTVGLAGAALALTACDAGPPQAAIDADALACPSGSDCYDEPRAVGPGGQLVVAADEFSFDIREGTAITGDVTFTLDNVGGAEHNIAIAGVAEEPFVAAPAGETNEGEIDLYPGEYTMFCDVPGHRASGMELTFQVFATEEEAQELTGEGAQEGSTEEPQDDQTEAEEEGGESIETEGEDGGTEDENDPASVDDPTEG